MENVVSYILEVEWMSYVELELYTDSVGGFGKGCAAYLQGRWPHLKWSKQWSGTDIVTNMTYLEIISIAIFFI